MTSKGEKIGSALAKAVKAAKIRMMPRQRDTAVTFEAERDDSVTLGAG